MDSLNSEVAGGEGREKWRDCQLQWRTKARLHGSETHRLCPPHASFLHPHLDDIAETGRRCTPSRRRLASSHPQCCATQVLRAECAAARLHHPAGERGALSVGPHSNPRPGEACLAGRRAETSEGQGGVEGTVLEEQLTRKSTSPFRFNFAQSSWLNPFSTRTRPFAAVLALTVDVGGASAEDIGLSAVDLAPRPSTSRSGNSAASSSSGGSSRDGGEREKEGGREDGELAEVVGDLGADFARCCELRAGKVTEVVSGSATMAKVGVGEGGGADKPKADCKRRWR